MSRLFIERSSSPSGESARNVVKALTALANPLTQAERESLSAEFERSTDDG